MIAIVDYKIGNITSVVNMLKRIGAPCYIATCAEDIERAHKIILPGNGAFDACIQNLNASGLVPVLEKHVLHMGKPLLGICVGAQMLGFGSEEGIESGLGWIDMQVKRFPKLPDLRVPHMGWNRAFHTLKKHFLVQNMEMDARFYFVHSYYMAPKNSADILFRSHYGIDFVSGVARHNIVGVQFHPEKSHRFGKQFLEAFSRWAC